MTEKELIACALDRADAETIHYIWTIVRPRKGAAQ